jgi:hypothetical protein
VPRRGRVRSFYGTRRGDYPLAAVVVSSKSIDLPGRLGRARPRPTHASERVMRAPLKSPGDLNKISRPPQSFEVKASIGSRVFAAAGSSTQEDRHGRTHHPVCQALRRHGNGPSGAALEGYSPASPSGWRLVAPSRSCVRLTTAPCTTSASIAAKSPREPSTWGPISAGAIIERDLLNVVVESASRRQRLLSRHPPRVSRLTESAGFAAPPAMRCCASMVRLL